MTCVSCGRYVDTNYGTEEYPLCSICFNEGDNDSDDYESSFLPDNPVHDDTSLPRFYRNNILKILLLLILGFGCLVVLIGIFHTHIVALP